MNTHNHKHSRRTFLQNTSLIGAAIPFAGLTGFTKEKPGITEADPYEENTGNKNEVYSIITTKEGVEITAGILKRSISLSNNQIKTKSLRVSETEILSAPSTEFQVTFYRADPNVRPPGLKLVDGDKPVWSNSTAANGSGIEQPVEWKDAMLQNGQKLAEFFKIVSSKVTPLAKGVTRLNIRALSFGASPLKDVTINVFYEIYDGYPAIRKWIEIVNNGFHWLKIDKLVIDDIDIASGFRTAIPLTPEEQGAESSLIAFTNTEHSSGIIAASEIPSATRKIEKSGAMGYANENFEWVIGPSENFISEPVFHVAFSGNVTKTISGSSTPLDRYVEGTLKLFMENCIGLRGDPAMVPAPIWCSYTNFLVDLKDADMREQANIAARCGFVTFQLDEGWAKTPSPGGSEPDEARFPHFDDTCRYITSKGLLLGLWISCYRGLDSKDMAALPSARSLPLFMNTKRGYAMSFSSSWADYFANDLVYMRDRYGMLYVKEDLTNISKGDVAEGHQSRTKKESLLRGLRGLLQTNKKVAELAPDVWTQITHEIYWRTPGPPADIAALKHACAFHTTPNTYLGAGNGSKRVSQDWPYDPLKLRADLIKSCWQARQRFYDHRGLPLYAVEFYAANAVNIKGSLTPAVQDRQVCSWLMGAPTVFAGDLSSLTNEHIEHYKNCFGILKRLQQTYGIYRYFQYSGVPGPTDTNWHWWGKLNQDGYGAVVVIRGSEGENTRVVNIPWVQSKRKYNLTALFSNKKLGSFTGSELMRGAIHLSLPIYGQEILELS